jgi:hypothetical protein
MHKVRHGDPVLQVFGDNRHRDPGAAEVLIHPTGGLPLQAPFRPAGQPAGGQCLIWRTLVCVDRRSWVAAPQCKANKADDA